MWIPRGSYSGNGRSVLDGLILSSPVIAVSIATENASGSWHFGGYIDQQITIEIGVANIALGKVSLRETTILKVQAIGEYQLLYTPAKWLDDWTLTVYEYIGENIFYG